MASVTSTYARAFADVVFDKHLDPRKTLQEAQSWRPVGGRAGSLREGLGSALDSGGTEARIAGCDCGARRLLAAGAKFCGRADGSSAHCSFCRSDRERV